MRGRYEQQQAGIMARIGQVCWAQILCSLLLVCLLVAFLRACWRDAANRMRLRQDPVDAPPPHAPPSLTSLCLRACLSPRRASLPGRRCTGRGEAGTLGRASDSSDSDVRCGCESSRSKRMRRPLRNASATNHRQHTTTTQKHTTPRDSPCIVRGSLVRRLIDPHVTPPCASRTHRSHHAATVTLRGSSPSAVLCLGFLLEPASGLPPIPPVSRPASLWMAPVTCSC